MSVTEDYILLGLRLGRHVDGLVDAYYGPAALKEQAAGEEPVDPAQLAADGDSLLAALEDGWLRDQALGLRTYAGVLAGEEIPYADEVERCYGVRPARGSTEVYAGVHERLDELLPPGDGLAARWQAWREANTVPEGKVVPVLRDLLGVLRERTAELVDLPAGESLVVEAVRAEPWWAFNYYLGDERSRVVVNLDVPTTADDVLELAAHEVYPGHHTEHALKERLLGETIQMVPTPAALVSEGIAETGPTVVLDPDALRRAEAIFAGHGIDCDLGAARAIRTARRPLRRVGLDAGLLIHEDGASPEEAQAHIERWALQTPEQAAHGVSFVTDPTWRAYSINYSAGYDVCHAWVGGDPARFARLLTEEIRVGELLSSP